MWQSQLTKISPFRLTLELLFWGPFIFRPHLHTHRKPSSPSLSICLFRLLPGRGSAMWRTVPVNPRHGTRLCVWWAGSLWPERCAHFDCSLLHVLYWHRQRLHSPPWEEKRFSLLYLGQCWKLDPPLHGSTQRFLSNDTAVRSGAGLLSDFTPTIVWDLGFGAWVICTSLLWLLKALETIG